jgi:hypothetical protein
MADGRGVLLRLGLDTAPSADPGADLNADAELIAPWSDRLRLAVLDQPQCPALPAGRYLIRPDGYLGWTEPAGASDPAALRSAIRRWFGEPGSGARTSSAAASASEVDRPTAGTAVGTG